MDPLVANAEFGASILRLEVCAGITRHMAVCRLLLSIKFNREVTPRKNCLGSQRFLAEEPGVQPLAVTPAQVVDDAPTTQEVELDGPLCGGVGDVPCDGDMTSDLHGGP